MVLGFLIFVFVIVINGIISAKFSEIAEMKGHEGTAYFWYTFFFGIVGMLMVVALPTINTNKTETERVKESGAYNYSENKSIKLDSNRKTATPIVNENATITCPLCNYEQPADRKVCWQCGANFEESKQRTVAHQWLCENCKKMRTQSPCEYCAGE